MGRYYSIKSYIKSEHLPHSLQWVYENSWAYETKPLQIHIQNKRLQVKGEGFTIHDGTSESHIDINNTLTAFKELQFSTSLIFDIDPKIIASIASWTLDDTMDGLDDFKRDFEEVYLGHGKIRIGSFDASIIKLDHCDVYEVEFTAVTSRLSDMLANSIAVKKWVIEFSKCSNAIVSCLDFESQSFRVLYYDKNIVDFELNDEFLNAIGPEIQMQQTNYSELFYKAFIEKVKAIYKSSIC